MVFYVVNRSIRYITMCIMLIKSLQSFKIFYIVTYTCHEDCWTGD
jgi:hypothetical protein